jgi:hypothetical protein
VRVRPATGADTDGPSRAATDSDAPVEANTRPVDDGADGVTGKKKAYVEPTEAELREISDFRETFRKPWEDTIDMLEGLFPDANILHRLKAPERIHESFHRKGFTFDTIDDVAGTCVLVDSLDDSVTALRQLQNELVRRGHKIIDPPGGALSDDQITGLLLRDKKRFRTTGLVVEVNGKMVEIGIQTKGQAEWTRLTHDTPVYKPNLFQAEWGINDAQTRILTDYAVSVSKYLHYVELSQMHRAGNFDADVPVAPRPAPPDWSAHGLSSTTQLDNLIGSLDGLVRGAGNVD